MDIYQIWTTYNKKWSKYEILAFSVLLLLTVIVVAGCVCRKKINTMQAMAVVMMVIFLGIVFGSTVFTRTSTVRQYELVPFWSWKAIFKYKDWELLKENLLNCILLLPAGALLPISEMVSSIIVWSSGIGSNRNQSVGIYAWIIRMG